MSELSDLYQEVILDHNRQPRNYGRLEKPDRHAEGHNPLCGDRYIIDLKMEGDVIREVRFEGSGCAISKASASMMTDSVRGMKKADATKLFEVFHQVVTGTGGDAAGLGKLAAFAGVSDYPVRVKCASLAWHTLKAALDGKQASISTE